MNDQEGKNPRNMVTVYPKYRTYTVKDGDDLRGISDQAYGNPDFYLEIARVNGLINFRNISAGTRLVLPPIEKKEGYFSQADECPNVTIFQIPWSFSECLLRREYIHGTTG